MDAGAASAAGAALTAGAAEGSAASSGALQRSSPLLGLEPLERGRWGWTWLPEVPCILGRGCHCPQVGADLSREHQLLAWARRGTGPVADNSPALVHTEKPDLDPQ